MSTNNNHSSRPSKDVLPKWTGTGNQDQTLPKVSGDKLNRMMKNMEDITALTLSNRGCTQIVDLDGLSKLRRLDISGNFLKRLSGMRCVPDLGMLNVSNNKLNGSQSLEELRYLPELRTLNIGYNSQIRHLESHIVKGKLTKLQALVCNECGLKSASFVKFCTNLNTLILSNNSLTVFPGSNDFTLRALTKLSLSKNCLEHIPNLSFCVNLQELRINNNEISTITDTITLAPKIKILDISNNKIDQWESIECLLKLQLLTNLSLHGNPLPTPPDTYDNTPLKEDYSNNRVDDPETKRYRHHVLSMFQVQVGAQAKTKVRLIVLDSKRVKMKWSHAINPKNEVLEDAVDLVDIDSGNRSSKGEDDVSVIAVPREKKRKLNKLSRSGKIKELPTGKATKIEKQIDEEVNLLHDEKDKKKKKKHEKARPSRLNTEINDKSSIVHESDGGFSLESGVVNVQVAAVVGSRDSSINEVHKEKRKVAAKVDLSILSGSNDLQNVGTGGSSVWD